MLYRLVIILLLQFSLTTVIAAQSVAQSSQKLIQGQKQKTISKATAIRIAKSQIKGKVLSATKIDSRGPTVYRIKMLIGESRVRTVFIDGITGKVIRIN